MAGGRRTRSGGPGGIPRRQVLRGIAWGAAGLALGALGGRSARAAEDRSAPRPAGKPRARAVVEVWLAGGPSHLDTFDPKPGAGGDFYGPLGNPIPTNADGVRIGELLPLLAQQADKYSLLRSMTHGVNAHETATYLVQTGREPGERYVFPCVGTLVSMLAAEERRRESLIPPHVVLTAPKGRFSEVGFLGPRWKPFFTGGDPSQRRFAVEGIVAEGVTDQRQVDRRALLHSLDTLGRAMAGDPSFDRFDACEEKAYGLILGDAGRLFDLSAEKDDLRDRYGRNTFGQSCLMARRLVEDGVPYVTINSGGWDTHKQNFETLRRKVPELDRGLAALLQDLADRGLLETTIVWCCGEFGRTPRVQWEAPWNGGRGHWGACFSALVAGGGFRGGRVVGASDARGEEVADRPVHPRDLLAAIFERLGFDPAAPLPNPMGLPLTLVEAAPPGSPGGRLAEIL